MNFDFTRITNIITSQKGLFVEYMYTSIVITIAILIYFFAKKWIEHQHWSIEKKFKKKATYRNLIVFITIISCIILWSGHLKTFIFSAAAIFSAILVVFKEIWLSVIGSVLSNKKFFVGDYIQFDNKRGMIVDKSFISTKIQLFNNSTNEFMVFPNSFYITHQIIQLSKIATYIYENIVVAIDSVHYKSEVISNTKTAIEEVYSGYEKRYLDYLDEKFKQNKISSIPELTPKISFDLTDAKSYKIIITILAHPNDVGDIQRAVLEKVLESK